MTKHSEDVAAEMPHTDVESQTEYVGNPDSEPGYEVGDLVVDSHSPEDLLIVRAITTEQIQDCTFKNSRGQTTSIWAVNDSYHPEMKAVRAKYAVANLAGSDEGKPFIPKPNSKTYTFPCTRLMEAPVPNRWYNE